MYKDGAATSAIMITAGESLENVLTAANWSPGISEDQSAYRGELCGIDGALSALKVIIDYYSINQGKIELALDNVGAKDQSDTEDILHIAQKSADIIRYIRYRLLHTFPENIEFAF